MAVYIHKFDATGVEEGIKRVEEKLNIKIPESYRNFLLKYNGGTTMRASFDIKNEESYILAFM